MVARAYRAHPIGVHVDFGLIARGFVDVASRFSASGPSRCSGSRGYGATRPVASNDDEAGRSKNRWVQFEILEQNAER